MNAQTMLVLPQWALVDMLLYPVPETKEDDIDLSVEQEAYVPSVYEEHVNRKQKRSKKFTTDWHKKRLGKDWIPGKDDRHYMEHDEWYAEGRVRKYHEVNEESKCVNGNPWCQDLADIWEEVRKPHLPHIYNLEDALFYTYDDINEDIKLVNSWAEETKDKLRMYTHRLHYLQKEKDALLETKRALSKVPMFPDDEGEESLWNILDGITVTKLYCKAILHTTK
jgi:hypothetical protein